MTPEAELLRLLAKEAKRAGHRREAAAYLYGAALIDGREHLDRD